MAKGTSRYDTSWVMSGGCYAIVMHHPELGAVAEFAAATGSAHQRDYLFEDGQHRRPPSLQHGPSR